MDWPGRRKAWKPLAEALAAAGLPLPGDAWRWLPKPGWRPPPSPVVLRRRDGAPPESRALRELHGQGHSAFLALRRWRGEPRDEEALAQAVRALGEAAAQLHALAPDRAEWAFRDFAWAAAHAAKFGPEDAPVVFERGFEAFAKRHLAALLPPAPRNAQGAGLPIPAHGPDTVPDKREGPGRVLPRRDPPPGPTTRPARLGPEPP